MWRSSMLRQRALVPVTGTRARVPTVLLAPRLPFAPVRALSAPAFTELPTDWRKLDYQSLEVMDTTELQSLRTLLEGERARVTDQRALAKEQQRKVLRVDCDLDLKRIGKIQVWIDSACKDKRRQW